MRQSKKEEGKESRQVQLLLICEDNLLHGGILGEQKKRTKLRNAGLLWKLPAPAPPAPPPTPTPPQRGGAWRWVQGVEHLGFKTKHSHRIFLGSETILYMTL